MKKKKLLQSFLALLIFMFVACRTYSAPVKPSVHALTKPLEERVQQSEIVFVGKLINKVMHGDWVYAELLVEMPLKNAKNGTKIKVTWRAEVRSRAIYDVVEGTQAIAILKSKREGRY